MSGWINVTWCPNPLRPASDRKFRSVMLSGSDTVDSVIKRMSLHGTLLSVTLNGVAVAKDRRHKKRVHLGDQLVLTQLAAGAETAGAAVAAEGAAKTAAEIAFVAFVEQVAVSLVISFIAQALLGGGGQTSNSGPKGVDGYSIEGGANQMRHYGPLAVVLGEHRLFPDYGSKPFTEFVNDPTATTDVVNGTPQLDSQSPPDFGFEDSPPAAAFTPISPWTLIIGDPATSYGYYGDNVTRSYATTGLISIGSPVPENVNAPHTFVCRYSADFGVAEFTTWEDYTWPDQDAGPNWQATGPFDVILRYGYLALVNTERLTNIFNFGFGDLTITDLRIGSTSITDYKDWERHDSTVPAGQLDRTLLQGYTCPDWVGTDYPTHVQSVEGGKLEQHAEIANDGWIVRQGLDGCNYIQLDLAGRLFAQANGGVSTLSCTFEAQYREVGAADWVDFDFSPITITNGITTPVRETLRAYMPATARYEVRVRRLTQDETIANNISDMSLAQAKFFIVDDTLYPAQKRLGLLVQATGQLNGRLDRLSAFVQAKHWVWNSAEPWTVGAYPGEDPRWVWTETTNPAWLFLYYGRGGFLNSTATPAHLGGGQGWLDRPDAGNGLRLFGAGLVDARIDYAAIVAWGQFCDANNLSCRMVVDSQRPCAEVLDDIATAGRASKTWAPGKLSVVWEAPDQPTVAVFGMPNIVAGTFQIGYDDDNTIDEYVLDYTNASDDYSPATVRAVVPGVLQPVNSSSVKATSAISPAQAQQQANLLAAARFYRRRHIQWESTREALMIQRGDVIALAHDLTQWAYSGRFIDMVAVDGNITTVQLSCEVDNAAGDAEFYIWLRRPDGTFVTIQCVPPAERTDTLTVITPWSTADAPGVFDMAEDDPDSSWPDSVPEDWMFLAGPTATPGKRVRITSIEPAGKYQFRISATDEYAEYYALADGGAAVDVASGERLVARAFNAGIVETDGVRKLVWELENAHGAEVMVSVNGGAATQIPVRGYLSVVGEELLLPEYAVGTTLAIQVLPIAAGTPVAIEGDTLNVTI